MLRFGIWLFYVNLSYSNRFEHISFNEIKTEEKPKKDEHERANREYVRRDIVHVFAINFRTCIYISVHIAVRRNRDFLADLSC